MEPSPSPKPKPAPPACPRCDGPMVERGCKRRCPRCHYFEDCSDCMLP